MHWKPASVELSELLEAAVGSYVSSLPPKEAKAKSKTGGGKK